MVRCPLCAAKVRELLRGNKPPQWKIDRADKIIAKATFNDWLGRYEHLVTEHNWKPRT